MRIFLLCLSVVTLSMCEKGSEKDDAPPLTYTYTPPVARDFPMENYGFNLDKYTVIADTVREGNSFGLIFRACELSPEDVTTAVRSAKGLVNLRKIRPGRPYKFLFTKDSIPKVRAFIYEESLTNYYIVHFDSVVHTERCSRDITLKTKIYKGVINSSLWETIQQEKLDSQLVYELANIFAWTVDFFRIYKGDKFKVILKERYINDTTYVGIEYIEGSLFKHNKEDFYAFRYIDQENRVNYYDEKGNSTRHTFLKAPIKYARITSRYSRNRFHPVLKRWRSHKGTDYGAPTGTPIMATASGVVIASKYSRANGNYVKIRHNNVYKTQYLHMVRRAVKRGQKIKQGQIIGYVGSTGLARGSHVCYRFWKNGVQVDPYRQRLPKSKSISKRYKTNYLHSITSLKKLLDSIKP